MGSSDTMQKSKVPTQNCFKVDSPVLCTVQEASLASSVGKFKHQNILFILQFHLVGSELVPFLANNPVSLLHLLKYALTSLWAFDFYT